jgi:hypothetical protein
MPSGQNDAVLCTPTRDKQRVARALTDSSLMRVDRRTFLNRAALTSGLTLTGIGSSWMTAPALASLDGSSNRRRHNAAYQCRMAAAHVARQRPLPNHLANGDEARYQDRAGSYSKGLPHDSLGNVDRHAYAALLAALESADPREFEQIPMAGSRKLVSPQAAFAFDLEGADAGSLAIRPAPALASAEAAGELAELYWMAAARDVPFTDYVADPLINAAAVDLSRLSDFRGPKQGEIVTPATIFRGNTPGDLVGPFVSQFLWMDIPMGALRIPQLIETATPDLDYLTSYTDWLDSQNGEPPSAPNTLDPTRCYIRDLRDLAQWVHVDALYQAYHQACLILLSVAPGDPGLPYATSATQEGFATFGGPHILSLVTEVATRALKAVWFQKWLVHRRLRPEAMGGLVHQTLSRMVDRPLHDDILRSAGPEQASLSHGTHLLPQAFAEGCPLHPSYGSGHATVAGACVTVLKAWFDESFVLPNPVVADATGLVLQPYTGPALTVGNELNKLAANVAIGRNAAGIHYRSDYWDSVRLGEQVALTILEEQRLTYNEEATLTLTLFDGTTITV